MHNGHAAGSGRRTRKLCTAQHTATEPFYGQLTAVVTQCCAIHSTADECSLPAYVSSKTLLAQLYPSYNIVIAENVRILIEPK